MPDAIIKELWKAKDDIAREHGYNVDALIAHLRECQEADERKVVDLSAKKRTVNQTNNMSP